MKKTLMLMVALLLSLGAGAQENKNPVYKIALNSVQYTKKDTKQTTGKVIGEILSAVVTGETTKQMDGYEDAVRAAIVKGFSQAHRISALDGQLTAEEAAQPHTWYADATIANISTTQKIDTYEDKDKKTHTRTYYKGIIGVNIHVKDAQTDEVKASPTFNVSATDLSWVETAEGALNNALVSLSSQITRYMNAWLPLKANIIEGAREKKDKQKEVYIDLGSAFGNIGGMHFDVFTVKTVAGHEAKKKIGRLKVTDVEGSDISLCKVQSGGRDIKAAIDAGESLLIISTD